MALIYRRPSDLVAHLTAPGLNTSVGSIPMKQYMSSSVANKGSETAQSFYGNMRPKLKGLVSDDEVDVLLKGQGSPDAMLRTMNYVAANKESLTFKINVQHREGKKNEKLVSTYNGSFYDRYFKNKSTATGLNQMVDEKIFGLDCIGFVANWMIYAGIWDRYYGYNIDKWSELFTERVRSYDDIEGMCITVWGSYHIGIIDRVTEYNDTLKAAEVFLCQSSSGGPRADKVLLFQKNPKDSAPVFDINGAVPVKGLVSVWRRPDLVYARPVSPPPRSTELSSPVGRWEVRVDKFFWIYDFAASGAVTWRDPFNGETGNGKWAMQESAQQMITTWKPAATTETWDLPLKPSGGRARCMMKGKLYDLVAVRK